MEIQAVMISDDVCVGSRFEISAQQIRTGNMIVLGRLVTGFVIENNNDRLLLDIKTALIDCERATGSARTSGVTWEVRHVLAALDKV